MIAHPVCPTYASLSRGLLISFVRMLANRRALRGLRAAQLEDCGITPEMLARAVDWRFWRRLDEPAPWVRQPVRAASNLYPLASIKTAG